MKNQATAELWSRQTSAEPIPGQPELRQHPQGHLDIERLGEVFVARLRKRRLDEPAILEMANELAQLITEQGCCKLVLSLGPDTPELLYSVFLAKLVMVHRLLSERGGALKLCDLTPQCRDVFEAC